MVPTKLLKRSAAAALWVLWLLSSAAGSPLAAKAKGGDKKKEGGEAPLTVQEVSRRMEEAQASVKDVQFLLKGEYVDTLSGEKDRLEARVAIRHPDRAFAHYTRPFEQFLYLDAKSVRIYHPEQKTVYVQEESGGSKGRLEIGVGREIARYMNKSRVSIIKDSKDSLVLLFIPKSDELGFESLKLTVDKTLWWPVSMEMETPSLAYRASFSDYRFNQNLPDTTFEFTPPEDAQVVEGAVF